MSRSPAFQFYPGDWQRNANLRRCTHEERGVWLDVMCLMHDSEEYGVLRWPLEEVALAVGCKVQILRSLQDKQVLKGAAAGANCQALTYIPRSGRQEGPEVVLLLAQQGPIWYSSRMVRDEYIRQHRGKTSQFDAGHQPKESAPDHSLNDAPKASPKPSLKHSPNYSPKPPFGEDMGATLSDGSSSASAFALKIPSSTGVKTPPNKPIPEDLADRYFRSGVYLLTSKGTPDKQARSLLGKWRRDHTLERAMAAVDAASAENAIDPVEFIEGIFRKRASESQALFAGAI